MIMDRAALLVDPVALHSALTEALTNREFAIEYQPKVTPVSGQIVGAEALLRWQHPCFGTFYPGDFIECCEGTGLIVPVGLWVLQTVCQFLSKCLREGCPVVPIAVNLSMRQLQDYALIDNVRAVIAEHNVSPGLVEFELTETSVIDNQHRQRTLGLLRRLRERGHSMTIDDFGTGYAGLSWLRDLPVDGLKIDQSFVRDIAESDRTRDIVAHVIRLAHELSISVVAEGVETQAQLLILRHIGCDEIQGYLYARPMPEEDFAIRLRQQRMIATTKNVWSIGHGKGVRSAAQHLPHAAPQKSD
jgi:EAL domain-containing protein (putative c-di-GMP-specific phosphodiesterase class I)